MISIKQSLLAKVLGKIQPALVAKAVSDDAVYHFVLIKRSGDFISFTATNMEIEITAYARIDAEQLCVNGDVNVCVPGKKLTNLVKSAPTDSMINLTQKGEDVSLSMSGMRSKFTLRAMSVDGFPLIDMHEGDASYCEIQTSVLVRCLESAEQAMAVGDVRYFLNGMHLSLSNNSLSFSATDGHRLIRNTGECIHIKGGKSFSSIVPRGSVKTLIGLSKADNMETVKLGVSSNHITAKIGATVYKSKLVDAIFPDVLKVIPKQNINKVTVDRFAIIHLLSRVSVLSNEKYRGVTLCVKDNSLSVSTQNQENESANDEVELAQSVDFTMSIGFNVDYILDAFKSAAGHDVDILFGDSQNDSVLIKSKVEPNWLAVVMPMRI